MYVIFAGFKYVQAKGNPAEIQKAHQRLLWTLIGVGVLLGAAGISAVLQTTVNSFLK
jgi:Tfp pilus assembly protein PilN